MKRLPRRTPFIYRPTAEEQRSVLVHSMRAHFIQPEMVTNLFSSRAWATLERFRNYRPSQRPPRSRLFMERDQACQALGIGRKQGIAGLIAEVRQDSQLYLLPKLVPTRNVFSLLVQQMRQRFAEQTRLLMTGRIRSWEVFSAMCFEDACRAERILAQHWDYAPDAYREPPYDDLFAFRGPAITLDDGTRITPMIRAYRPGRSARGSGPGSSPAVGRFVKVEVYWHHLGCEWRNMDLVHRALLRLLGRLFALVKPKVVNLNKLTEPRSRRRRREKQTGQWHGRGLDVRTGGWQRRVILYLDRQGPRSLAAITAWSKRAFDKAPERRKLLRSMKRLANRGLIDAHRGPDPIFGPVTEL